MVKIGAVETSARSSSPVLTPLPQAPSDDMMTFLREGIEEPPSTLFPMLPPGVSPAPRTAPAAQLLQELAATPPREHDSAPEQSPEELEEVIVQVLRAIMDDPEATLRSAAVLFQDFQVRCRMAGVKRSPLDPPPSPAASPRRAGIFDRLDGEWQQALEQASDLPDDMLGAFLLVARAAREGEPCPSDEDVARTYGTSSLGRARRVMSYIEGRNIFVTRVDLSGKRSITIPGLGWTTASAEVG